MNKKRKYLCLLSKLIAEKIITNKDDRLENEVAIKIINKDMVLRIVFSDSKTHDNFSIWICEFQSFKSLIKARKEIFNYLNNSDKTLNKIHKKDFMLYDFKKSNDEN